MDANWGVVKKVSQRLAPYASLAEYAALLLVLSIAFAIKLAAIRPYEIPFSSDVAGYIAELDVLKGRDPFNTGLSYPPLWGRFLWALAIFSEPLVFLKRLGPFLATFAIGLPFFFLARRFSNAPIAILAVALLVFSKAVISMFATSIYVGFAAMAVMLVAYYFLLESLETPRPRNLLLAGLSISIVAGMHPHTLILMVAGLAPMMVLGIIKPPHGSRRRFIKTMGLCFGLGVLFSFPYLLYYLHLFTTTTTSAGAQAALPLVERLRNFHWEFKHALTPWDVWVSLLGIGLAGLFLSRRAKSWGGLFIISLALGNAAAALTIYSSTPARPLLYLILPILLSFAVSLDSLWGSIKRWQGEAPPWLYPLAFKGGTLAISTLLLTSIFYYYVTFLPTPVKFWALRDDEIALLHWMRANTNREELVLAQTPRDFYQWIQAYAKNPTIGADRAQRYLVKGYLTDEERERAHTASTILAGKDILENGNLRASDTFPSPNNIDRNPTLGVFVGDFQDIMFFPEGNAEFSSFTQANPTRLRTVSPLSAPTKRATPFQGDGEGGHLSYEYGWSGIELNRATSLKRGATDLDLKYTVAIDEGSIVSFYLRTYFLVRVDSYHIEGSAITLDLLNRYDRLFTARLSVETTGGAPVLEYVDTGASLPYVALSIPNKAESNNMEVKVKVSFTLPLVQNDPVRYFDSPEVAQRLGIKYILLDKNEWRSIQWLEASGYFQQAFESGRLVLFSFQPKEIADGTVGLSPEGTPTSQGNGGTPVSEETPVPWGNLEVSVIGEDSSPIAGARVTVFQPEKFISQSGVADERGQVSFLELGLGRYIITAAKPGFGDGERGEDLTPAATKEVTLALLAIPFGVEVFSEPLSLTLPQGSQGTATVAVVSYGGLPGDVKLGAWAVGGIDLSQVGITVAFDPPSLTLGGEGQASSTLTFRARPEALEDTYLVRIEARYDVEGKEYAQSPIALMLRVASP